MKKYFVAAALCLLTAGAMANPQFNQRIEQGVKSGSLTKQELQRIQEKRQALKAERQAYRSDGKLSRAERHDLKKDQQAISRQIKRQKHDKQHR